MPVRSDLSLLQPSTVTEVPDKPGVFELLSGKQTILLDWSDLDIRAKLREHMAGKHGSCTKIATHFRWEDHKDADKRYETLLEAYKEKHGKTPRCNSD